MTKTTIRDSSGKIIAEWYSSTIYNEKKRILVTLSLIETILEYKK